MAYRHILWAPGGDDVTTHFAIAGPDLKLFWEQLQQERGQGSRPHFAEPAENTRTKCRRQRMQKPLVDVARWQTYALI